MSLITADGVGLRTIPKAVACKNMNGVTTKAWREAKVLNKVPVDRGALRGLRAHLERISGDEQRLATFGNGAPDENAATVDYYLGVIARVLLLSRTDVAGEGFLMHRYVEAKSGRLYACNLNLQTVPRLIKQAALHGLWEYDFANCHYAIFAQLAGRFGITCSEILKYIANKDATRRGIAERNGLSTEEAKTCLLAIMYGARASEWHQTAIPHTIGVERAKRLYQDSVFKALLGELEATRAAIIDAWPHRNREHIVNDVGYGIDTRESAKCVLAHLLQGVEAKMLRAVVDAFADDLLLLQHDGFASRRQLDVAEIAKVVEEATGYRMGVEEERIRLRPEIERSILIAGEFRPAINDLRGSQGTSLPVNRSLVLPCCRGGPRPRRSSENVQHHSSVLCGARKPACASGRKGSVARGELTRAQRCCSRNSVAHGSLAIAQRTVSPDPQFSD